MRCEATTSWRRRYVLTKAWIVAAVGSAINADIAVFSVPGPTAAITALVSAGLPTPHKP